MSLRSLHWQRVVVVAVEATALRRPTPPAPPTRRKPVISSTLPCKDWITSSTASRQAPPTPRREFTYTPGQAVTFKIGQVILGTVSGNDLTTVTPASLASSTASVDNILILLQSLDSDGNPDNGIVIPADTGAKLKTAVDLSQAGSTLATVKQDLPTQTWVSADAAVQHFATGVAAAAPGAECGLGRGPPGRLLVLQLATAAVTPWWRRLPRRRATRFVS